MSVMEVKFEVHEQSLGSGDTSFWACLIPVLVNPSPAVVLPCLCLSGFILSPALLLLYCVLQKPWSNTAQLRALGLCLCAGPVEAWLLCHQSYWIIFYTSNSENLQLLLLRLTVIECNA